MAAVSSWVFDASDVDMAETYADISRHFGQFGFFDRSTYADFLDHVLLPNTRWVGPHRAPRAATAHAHAPAAPGAADEAMPAPTPSEAIP